VLLRPYKGLLHEGCCQGRGMHLVPLSCEAIMAQLAVASSVRRPQAADLHLPCMVACPFKLAQHLVNLFTRGFAAAEPRALQACCDSVVQTLVCGNQRACRFERCCVKGHIVTLQAFSSALLHKGFAVQFGFRLCQ